MGGDKNGKRRKGGRRGERAASNVRTFNPQEVGELSVSRAPCPAKGRQLDEEAKFRHA